MSQIDTNSATTQQVIDSFGDGSEVSSVEMVSMGIAATVVLTIVIVVIVVVETTQDIKNGDLRESDVNKVIKNFALAIVFFAIVFLLIGVFYAF